MKHKVAELEGALLDAAVAKAEGLVCMTEPHGFPMWCRADGSYEQDGAGDFSTRWSLGGPIIERERLRSSEYEPENQSGERWHYWTPDNVIGHGPTPLIAAMRAYVASKFGEEVELP